MPGGPDLNDPVRKLQDQFAISQRDLEYRLDVMGMKRTWQESQAENLDAAHPVVLDLYIPQDTKLIQRARLRLRLGMFRSYGATASAGGGANMGTTGTAENFGTLLDVLTFAGSHTHGGTVPSDGDHTHSIRDHRHDVTLIDHIHPIDHGIYEGPFASDVTVKINGVDRTVALGGPFNADQPDLDIVQYLTTTGWNTIEIGSATLGRVAATVFVELYLP